MDATAHYEQEVERLEEENRNLKAKNIELGESNERLKRLYLILLASTDQYFAELEDLVKWLAYDTALPQSI